MIKVIREIAEPSRRLILSELMTGPKCVNVLVERLHLKQPNVSNHLAKLRDRGFVRKSKVGRQVFYSIASPEVEAKLKTILASKSVDTECHIDQDIPKAYARVACAGNETACSTIVDALIEQHVPVNQIYRELFAPGMRIVGKWYEVEAIDEGHEHLASAITERMMARVMHYTTVERKSSIRAVIGSVQGDYHSLGLRMAADVLKAMGAKTFFLGGNVPISGMRSAIEAHRPTLVLLGCSVDEVIPTALQTIRELKALRKPTHQFVIGVGGFAAREHREQLMESGADFVAMSLDCLIDHVIPAMETKAEQPSGALGEPEP